MKSSTIFVLVNGSPTEEFKPTRGLRQGDPLTPFLFIVVAEGLAGLVRQATKASLLSGVKIGREEVELCILQFADDTLFLCEESHSNVVTLKAILRGFEIASGLKVNFHKSKIAGVNVGGNVVASYAKMLNYAQMRVPFKYLGLEVGGNPRTVKFWEPVLTKLKARLNGWRGRFLSLAGRISLVKTIISSVPLYYLSIFKAPESIYKNITSIQRRFLWGWGKEKRPIQWVSWEDVCKSKEDGGLGIRDIRKFNLALLARWRWRLVSNEEGRWKDLLATKYGMVTEGLRTPVKTQSWWWRDLQKVCKEGGGEGWFQQHIAWKLEGGDKVKFWEDVWIGNNSLQSLYPRLFTLSLNQGLKVNEVGEWVDAEWQWNLRWRRDRFEWESLLETKLLHYISQVRLSREQRDVLTWGGKEAGSYTVSLAYEFLAKRASNPHQEVFKPLWKIKAFPNIIITAWRVLLGRVPTRTCLRRRGVMLNTVLCVFCQTKEESCQHIFIECPFAQRVWTLCFKWIGITFVQHNELSKHFESFFLPHLNSKQNLL